MNGICSFESLPILLQELLSSAAFKEVEFTYELMQLLCKRAVV